MLSVLLELAKVAAMGSRASLNGRRELFWLLIEYASRSEVVLCQESCQCRGFVTKYITRIHLVSISEVDLIVMVSGEMGGDDYTDIMNSYWMSAWGSG